jgi:hypothetical protein
VLGAYAMLRKILSNVNPALTLFCYNEFIGNNDKPNSGLSMEYINQFAGIIARVDNYIDLETYKAARNQLIERIKVQNTLRLEVGLDEMDESLTKAYIANNVRVSDSGIPSDFSDNTNMIRSMIEDCKKVKAVGNV